MNSTQGMITLSLTELTDYSVNNEVYYLEYRFFL